MKSVSYWRSFFTVLIAASFGIPLGVGAYVFYYGKGYSYLSNDPEVCANCHVMREHLGSWNHSSHHSVAVCNDCHNPDSFIGKYVAKSVNGFNHGWAFTTGVYIDPIQIKPMNTKIVESACARCHASIHSDLFVKDAKGQRISCLRCHANVGHMR